MYSRVYVEVTNICNMHCSFCHGHSRQPRKMQMGEFSHILQQLQGKTQYIYYHLMGEPLTHPQLPDMIRLAGEQGFRSVITTNGTLLHQRGQVVFAAGLHKMFVSVHSFEGQDMAQCRSYLADIVEAVKWAENAGTILSLRLWNKGCDQGRNEQIVSFLQENLSGEWTENTRGFRIRDKVFLEWGDRFQWPDRDAPDGGDQVFCYGLKDHFGILSDGTVVPCCLDSDGVISLGNIFTESVSEILNSDRAKAMVQGFQCRKATEELCHRCGYARRF